METARLDGKAAALALANKLARIVWAVWRHERSFDGDHARQLAAAA